MSCIIMHFIHNVLEVHMIVINQPFQGQLGTTLIDELNENYSSLTIFSAFAKNSGVLRLKPALERHRANGGRITAFIGIDLDGTSYEALLNLYSLCDDLYVIHSESFSTTFHSKIYLLEKADAAWCAVGSNNLTGGGLWTNFESCSIETYSLPSEQSALDNIHEIIQKYMDANYECSSRISCVEDIDRLLDANYIFHEVSQRMKNISRQPSQGTRQRLFGTERVSMPALVSAPRTGNGINTPSGHPAFTNEQFWFEMRESTGGSRNILDLSKLGKIAGGSVNGTSYEYTPDPSKMYGGVKFFEIDPEDTNREKNITINYCGKDYFPSTIKFAPNNGSWRIQLKGEPSDGSVELSRIGNRGQFVHKILVFDKINPDYYVLSLLDESELPEIKNLSRVWAHNGSSSSSKSYGMF
jgi:HKD family nuclease